MIAHEPIIEDFLENDKPEVYEPPFGCSYSLYEADKKCIEEIQNMENVLVWGVIREFLYIDDYCDVRDNYLFVGSNKMHWEEERQALVDSINKIMHWFTQGEGPEELYMNIEVEADVMEEYKRLKKEDPKKWDHRDLDCLDQAKRNLGKSQEGGVS